MFFGLSIGIVLSDNRRMCFMGFNGNPIVVVIMLCGNGQNEVVLVGDRVKLSQCGCYFT